MDDNKDNKNQENRPAENRQDENPAGKTKVMIRKQYMKDISFENPLAPETLGPQGKPDMDVSFSVEVNPLPKPDDLEEDTDLYEVVIGLKANATRAGKTAFIAEISHGMEVGLRGESKDQHHPILYIEMPRQAFPFIRHMLSTLTQSGGYPPLLLAPVDFRAMYMQQFADQAQSGQKEQKSQS